MMGIFLRVILFCGFITNSPVAVVRVVQPVGKGGVPGPVGVKSEPKFINNKAVKPLVVVKKPIVNKVPVNKKPLVKVSPRTPVLVNGGNIAPGNAAKGDARGAELVVEKKEAVVVHKAEANAKTTESSAKDVPAKVVEQSSTKNDSIQDKAKTANPTSAVKDDRTVVNKGGVAAVVPSKPSSNVSVGNFPAGNRANNTAVSSAKPGNAKAGDNKGAARSFMPGRKASKEEKEEEEYYEDEVDEGPKVDYFAKAQDILYPFYERSVGFLAVISLTGGVVVGLIAGYLVNASKYGLQKTNYYADLLTKKIVSIRPAENADSVFWVTSFNSNRTALINLLESNYGYWGLEWLWNSNKRYYMGIYNYLLERKKTLAEYKAQDGVELNADEEDEITNIDMLMDSYRQTKVDLDVSKLKVVDKSSGDL